MVSEQRWQPVWVHAVYVTTQPLRGKCNQEDTCAIAWPLLNIDFSGSTHVWFSSFPFCICRHETTRRRKFTILHHTTEIKSNVIMEKNDKKFKAEDTLISLGSPNVHWNVQASTHEISSKCFCIAHFYPNSKGLPYGTRRDDKGIFLLMDTGAGRLCCRGGHSAAAASMAALPLAESERSKVQTTHKHSNDCERTWNVTACLEKGTVQGFNFSHERPGSQSLEHLMCIGALMLVLEGKRHQLSDLSKSILSILRLLFLMNTFFKNIFIFCVCHKLHRTTP